jgi:protein SCO1/2
MAVTGLVVLAAVASACQAGAGQLGDLRGMVRSPALNVSDVSVPSAEDGGDVAMRADDGRVLVVYFGYTRCPDICPTTMADLRQALEDMGRNADRVDVAFMSVDPRDDADQVLAYVQAFFPSGIGLYTDDPGQLATVITRFEAAFEVAVEADGTVQVAHSSLLYAIDSTGTIVVQWPFGMSADDIRADLEQLVRAA